MISIFENRLGHPRFFINILIILTFINLSFSIAKNNSEGNKCEKLNEDAKADNLKVEIIENKNETYGYEIWENDNRIIHQPNIPVITGNDGFSKKKDAFRTGCFVISKIQKDIFPPTITISELDSLGVL